MGWNHRVIKKGDDLIARVFEAGLFKLPLVTNMVPDLTEHFVPGSDMMVYDRGDLNGMVNGIKMLLDDPAGAEIFSSNLNNTVRSGHTYDDRIQQIIDKIG